VSTLGTYNDPENGYIIVIIAINSIICIICIIAFIEIILVIEDGWNQLALESYTSSTTRQVLYVISMQIILEKLQVVPVGDTGTIPHHLRNVFPSAAGNRVPAMDAACGLSTRGHWDGPVICN
jgi:hypothetical protein